MPKAKMTKENAIAYIESRGLSTIEAALDAYLAKIEAKWGAAEREPARRMARKSHALILNSIAVFDVNAIDEPLKAAARAIMTDADLAFLRSGG
jgi:hypothetical protein